jgi:O-ureido-D-serine cyclo-ligase
MPTLALVTAVAATGLDDDLAPLSDACRRAGFDTRCLAWDDATVSWGRFDMVLLRSPWDYTERYAEFLAWCQRIDQVSALLNPLAVIRWNTDKHYLAELAAAGVAVVASTFVEPDSEPLPALQAFLARHDAADFVVKPAISAGSRDTQRYVRSQEFAASNHIARLLEEGRSVMLQPYLASVDSEGETALIYFDGQFSHAIRKGPLLRPEQGATEALFAAEAISPRDPAEDERALADRVLRIAAASLRLNGPLSYARVDLIRDADNQPHLLELELTEPSLFFAHAAGSAEDFATRLAFRFAELSANARTPSP